MYDDTEKFWLDLVEKLKREIGGNQVIDSVAFHNRIWSAISEAFRRGQKIGPT